MLQQDPSFFFSKPTIYFGSFQHIQEIQELEGEEEADCPFSEFSPFFLDIRSKKPTDQTTGLYLHWPSY